MLWEGRKMTNIFFCFKGSGHKAVKKTYDNVLCFKGLTLTCPTWTLTDGWELHIKPNVDRGERRWCHLWIQRILSVLTHQMFWGGEVSGGHLSAECLLVSMLCTGRTRLSSSGQIMASGRQTGSRKGRGRRRRREGEKELKRMCPS